MSRKECLRSEPAIGSARLSGAVKSRQEGYILLLSLGILAGIITLGVSMMRNASSGRKIASVSGKGSQSRYAAESAIAMLINRAANSVDSNGYLVEFPASDLKVHKHEVTVGMEVEEDEMGEPRVDSIRTKYDLLTFRSYANIEASSLDPISKSTARIRQRIAFDQFPMFQFAFYWEGTMKLDPGSDMTITGRVHCNSRANIFPVKNLSLEDWFTTPCTILHKSTGSSQIRFKRQDGIMGAYRTPPSSFTVVDTPYYGGSKRMRIAYGSQVPYFKMPVGARNPIIIIQPKGVNDRGVSGFTESQTTKKQKMVYKADLILRKRNASGAITNDWYRNNPDGTDSPVSAALKGNYNTALDIPTTAGSTPDILYDFGDRQAMNVTYVNLQKFFVAASDPADKILYLEGVFNPAAGRRDVFCLYQGSVFPRGFTIVSNVPVYIWGDYNNISGKPSAVVADIVNVLSKNWKGSYTSASATRPGMNGTVKTCIMGGVRRARVHPAWNNPDDPGYMNWDLDENSSYSDHVGEPHNLMSFMEDWTGNTLTYSGSQVGAWRCLYLTGQYRWNPGNTVYVQPTRNYSFDPIYNQLANMPPGTPTVIAPFNLDYYEIHEE